MYHARVHFANHRYAAVFYDNVLDAVAAALRIRHVILCDNITHIEWVKFGE